MPPPPGESVNQSMMSSAMHHSENKNVIELISSEIEVKAAVQQVNNNKAA